MRLQRKIHVANAVAEVENATPSKATSKASTKKPADGIDAPAAKTETVTSPLLGPLSGVTREQFVRGLLVQDNKQTIEALLDVVGGPKALRALFSAAEKGERPSSGSFVQQGVVDGPGGERLKLDSRKNAISVGDATGTVVLQKKSVGDHGPVDVFFFKAGERHPSDFFTVGNDTDLLSGDLLKKLATLTGQSTRGLEAFSSEALSAGGSSLAAMTLLATVMKPSSSSTIHGIVQDHVGRQGTATAAMLKKLGVVAALQTLLATVQKDGAQARDGGDMTISLKTRGADRLVIDGGRPGYLSYIVDVAALAQGNLHIDVKNKDADIERSLQQVNGQVTSTLSTHDLEALTFNIELAAKGD